MAKEKNRSLFWPLFIMGIPFSILLAIIVVLTIDPAFMVGHNKPRVTEQNFNTALVELASVHASIVPQKLNVAFKTADGIADKREIVLYSYGAEPVGGKYALYFYPKENMKEVKIHKAFIPEIKKETVPWYKKTVKDISSWPIWARVGTLHIDVNR